MKFGKEYASQMVPEWQEAYMDYDQLKAFLKEIQWIKQRNRQAAAAAAANEPDGLTRAYTLYRAFSGLIRHNHPISQAIRDIESSIVVNSVDNNNGSHSYETTFLMATDDGGEYEQEFFRRLDDEFNKVDIFYRSKVQEVMAEAESLDKQMDALIAFRIRALALDEELLNFTTNQPGESDQRMTSEGSRQEQSTNHETNNQQEQQRRIIQFPLDILNRVKLHKRFETPYAIIKDLVNCPKKQKVITFNKENLKKVEKQLKRAFIQFYHKIRLLKGYSFLNILAFSKIMKKYDKITSRRESTSYMKTVDDSYLGSSDELTKLMERVEATFIKHFSNSNRRKGMNILRPKTQKQTHTVSFFTGILSGCTVALMLALIFTIRARHLFNKEGHEQYMETMFPLYSFFAFIVLHMLMYAANIYFWRQYRANYAFIFGVKQGTELRYMDILLVSFGLAVLALISVIMNLDMELDPKTHDYKAVTELLPLGLVLIVIVIVTCPLNILYRSSRLFIVSSLFQCFCAPLYKVSFQDFFLADQLTSQVQAFRSLEFYICYYGWGDYKLRQSTCNTSGVYNTFYIIVAIIPYWFRFLQCLRRLFEEKDRMHGYNGMKYFMTIIAISTRSAHSLYDGMGWKIIAVISSAVAAIYGTYWDLIMDWGLLQRQSTNRWLRDKLLVPYKTVYFVAMVLNVLLRFAWLQTVLDIKVPYFHRETVITIFASLEIIRRGLWNFFRLENEHLNNVGKYRAFKSVPLPFKYYEQEDAEE